jgi:hypothetical protein
MQTLLVRAVSAVLPLVLIAGTDAVAEERCKIEWEVSAADAKFTQQLMLDVGDVPGHKIGTFELHRTFSQPPSTCEGAKVVEQWNHGFRDLINRNGRAWGYSVMTLDNGDKIYQQVSGTVQTQVAEDGSTRSTYEGVSIWRGGTGRYQAIQGIQREHSLVEYAADSQEAKKTESRSEVEYWFEK